MNLKSKRIGIIGAGNMAHFLVRKLQYTQFPVTHLHVRKDSEDVVFANKYKLQIVEDICALELAVDVLFILVQDDRIQAVANELRGNDQCIYVHCSGTKGLEVFHPNLIQTGIFWPIYSIHKNKLPDHRSIPIMISSEQGTVASVLMDFAAEISNLYAKISMKEKQILHLLAVMSNNFMTHLAHITQSLAKDKKVDFDWVKPIIQQTFTNVLNSPQIGTLQTGPAIRGDEDTIHMHEALLSDQKSILYIYQVLTKSIIEFNAK